MAVAGKRAEWGRVRAGTGRGEKRCGRGTGAPLGDAVGTGPRANAAGAVAPALGRVNAGARELMLGTGGLAGKQAAPGSGYTMDRGAGPPGAAAAELRPDG